jgi:class 3 adenylate cyclase
MLVIFRRKRFADVIARQLDVFAEDEATGLFEEVREKKGLYERAERSEAEEAYGDYVDVVEAATEALAEMRYRFRSTLDEAAGEEYEEAFNRAVKKRWPHFGLEIENR